MPRLIYVLLLASATLAAHAATAQQPARAPAEAAGPFEFAGLNEAWVAAQESRAPVLLFVSSDHCFYCKKMVNETLTHPTLAPVVARLFETATVNADRNPELIEKLGVRVYPTTLVVSPEGQLLGKLEGFVPPQELGKRLNPVLRDYYQQTAAPANAVANR